MNNPLSSTECDSSDSTQANTRLDVSYRDPRNISPISQNIRSFPRNIIGQNKIISPPPGLLPGSFPPRCIDTSVPPPLYPHPFRNSHHNSPNGRNDISFDPFRPPPSLPNPEPAFGSYSSIQTLQHTNLYPTNSPHNQKPLSDTIYHHLYTLHILSSPNNSPFS